MAQPYRKLIHSIINHKFFTIMYAYHKLRCCPNCGSARITKSVEVFVNEPSTIGKDHYTPAYCPECKQYIGCEDELPYLDDYIENIIRKGFESPDGDFDGILLDEDGGYYYIFNDKDFMRKVYREHTETFYAFIDGEEPVKIMNDEQFESAIENEGLLAIKVWEEEVEDITRSRYIIPVIAEQLYRAFL